MSVRDAEKAAPVQTAKRLPGIKAALRYTGIPSSWLDKRPKLPSRNWLIFLSAVSSVTALYVYDRKQCKQIRQFYVDRVKSISEEPAHPLDQPRKVSVYGAKWPGDEDYDQCMKYFRKYVKPILVAAAVDYDMVVGKRHGDITNRVANDVRLRRRMDLGIDVDSDYTKVSPTYKTLTERRQKELEGGIVIVGRPTFKEFMAGLTKGWADGLEEVDQEEELAKELQSDGYFDEPEDADKSGAADMEHPHSHRLTPRTPIYAALRIPSFTENLPVLQEHQSIPENILPSEIPQLPPILFVPFIDYIGFRQIPLMLWNFFNQRQHVKTGAEAAYRLIMNASRPFKAPQATGVEQSDLDLGKDGEAYYKKFSLVDDINKARQKYYEKLPPKLQVARELARGSREPTKEERENPPSTEVELSAERMNKERRWRGDLTGWLIVDPSSSVAWNERFRNALLIFLDNTQYQH